MPMSRRAALAGLAAAPLLSPSILQAQGSAAPWPTRPLRLVIPFPPGGASDLLGRLMAERIGAFLGQPVVVENRGGAGGLVAAEYCARQPGDGYTLFQGTQATQVFNKHLYHRLNYDPDRDFTPLGTIASVAYVLSVNPQVPASNVAELIAHARAHPGRVNYGSSGMGSGMHLATHIFAQIAGGDMVHVPYRGAGPAVTALVAGEIQLMVDLVPNCLPLVRAGSLKAFAVGLPERTPLLPETPTFGEFGIADFDIPSWFMMVATGSPPPEVTVRLAAAVDAAVTDATFADRLAAVAAAPMRTPRAQLPAFLAQENARWTQIVRSANVKLD
ncbi:tripartite tricarboxylate transporter substrate binding protein [Roseococcus sp. SYP-B2431]|uniref:Bug family tripartite tricarboxylate transporter substrate binding protein n=1 Tax=Roseococcus sp. SYP-B2431 TaxID=2496640 RepID=UPI00103F59FE|nr:tripartite tricarboxylate transporter substrate-binding protein [Roseococcus sp. SYP-B2431]TCH96471.1 tripartite tricarboxylate transporter substrate binding protein [Roseococcus sp. SYP-B2431]